MSIFFKKTFSLSLFSLLLTVACSSQPQGSSTARDGLTPDAGSFHLRTYTSETWENGLQVITIEAHNLPSISFALLLKAGSANDPMAKSGLMDLMTAVMMKGTTSRTASQIADGLGDLGSEFEKTVSEDFGWFQVSGLSNHQDKLFDIFSDVILHPQFDVKELDRQKKIVIASMDQRVDHPEEFADQAFNAYLFGGHPYSRPVYGVRADVKALKKNDLIKYYSQKVRPNNAVLVITGDIDAESLAKIKNTFGAWSKREELPGTFPTVPPISGFNVRLVDKPDLSQSQIIIGHLGIKRNDPDYLPLKVASIILGGDFSSRLMSQVRVKLGLTYGITSSFEPRLDRGPFEITTFTKNQTVGLAITESLKVFKNFYENGVTAEEVESAKNLMVGNFPRVIETPEKLGFNLALLRYYGISDDYLQNFIKNVTILTTADINGVIRRHMNVNDLKILVLSNAAQAAPQLRTLGLLEIKKFNEIF